MVCRAIRVVLAVIAMGSATALQSWPKDHFLEEISAMVNLVRVAESYVAVLNQMGRGELPSQSDIDALCAEECVKVVNGATWYEGRDNFIPQLLKTQENVGSWEIRPLDIIPGQDGSTVVLHFVVPTERGACWNTMVILRCNAAFQIEEIYEVFNVYEGVL